MWHIEDVLSSGDDSESVRSETNKSDESSEAGYEDEGAFQAPLRNSGRGLSSTMRNHGDDEMSQTVQRLSKSVSKSMKKSTQAMTLASIRIEPCIPAEGESSISHHAYSRWKDVIVATLEAIPGLTENEKFNVFNWTAGSKLIDLLESLSLERTEAAVVEPFSDALLKLDSHFNSDQNKFLAKTKFRTTRQGLKESSLDYLNRMLKLVKFCGFSPEEQETELMLNIAANTSDSDVRKQALKKGCKFQDLRECILSLELNKDIEKRNASSAKVPDSNELNAVSFQGLNSRQGYNTYGNRRSFRGPPQPQRFNRNNGSDCSRCGRFNHSSENCPSKDKACNACGKIGHFAAKCRTKSLKRRGSPSATSQSAKSTKINEISPIHHSDMAEKVGNENDLE